MVVYHIFQFLVCFLQIFAAVVAVRLTRYTKLNIAWILICVGLVIWSVRSLIDIINIFVPGFGAPSHQTYPWGSFLISTCFAVGVFFIQHIFRELRTSEERQRAIEKRLLNSVIEAEENERKRFAAELHDGLGPILSSIKMSFSAISSDITDQRVRSNLSVAINEAITTVREVSNNLSPHVLNNFGLQKAVTNFVAKIEQPDGPRISYNLLIGGKRYPPTHEIVVYRVVCELLNNTLRHARATEADFSINEERGFILLDYSDNGVGFNPETRTAQDGAQKGKGGTGYYNMLSRVSSLKGAIEFRPKYSAPNLSRPGIIVNVKIPITDE